jgi:tetratricopeptide (TPR) repeat protein
MTRRLRILLGLLALASSAVALPALAQPPPPAPGLGADSTSNEPKTKEQLEAQQHFQRAKDLYQTGAYREAIAELEHARGLDPKAKDLVFNLGIVHEKLGKFDEAITFFRQYMEMESVTGVERAKAENIIKRIEGAKREVPVTPPAGAAEPTPTHPESTGNGRIDAATVTAGSIAIVGLGIGATFGILALSNKPSGFVTGRDGTYDTLQSKTSDAHTQALVADIGFGVGIAAALVTTYLYFGRSKEATPRANRTPTRGGLVPSLVPSFAPTRSGGAVLFGGTFL